MGRYEICQRRESSDRNGSSEEYKAYVPHPLAGWNPAPVMDAPLSFSGVELDIRETTAALEALPVEAHLHWLLAREESIRSSRIEGIHSTGVSVARAEYAANSGRPIADSHARATFGNVLLLKEALRHGTAGGMFTLNNICEMHQTLMEHTEEPEIGGVLRKEQVWIGPPGCSLQQATFVPPPPAMVRELMDDLVEYINSDHQHPLLQAAIAHAQFETIHPFADGNGRTGRALIHVVLRRRGLGGEGVLPVSTTLEARRDDYYSALARFQKYEGAANSPARWAAMAQWQEVFLEASAEACEYSRRLTSQLHRILESWAVRVKPQKSSALVALLDVIPKMPVLDVKLAAKALNASERNVRRSLQRLERAGVVRPIGNDKRNRRYEAHEIVNILRPLSADGGLDVDSDSFLADAALSSTDTQSKRHQDRCPYVGPRTKLRCVLGEGHRGNHRYT